MCGRSSKPEGVEETHGKPAHPRRVDSPTCDFMRPSNVSSCIREEALELDECACRLPRPPPSVLCIRRCMFWTCDKTSVTQGLRGTHKHEHREIEIFQPPGNLFPCSTTECQGIENTYQLWCALTRSSGAQGGQFRRPKATFAEATQPRTPFS